MHVAAKLIKSDERAECEPHLGSRYRSRVFLSACGMSAMAFLHQLQVSCMSAGVPIDQHLSRSVSSVNRAAYHRTSPGLKTLLSNGASLSAAIIRFAAFLTRFSTSSLDRLLWCCWLCSEGECSRVDMLSADEAQAIRHGLTVLAGADHDSWCAAAAILAILIVPTFLRQAGWECKPHAGRLMAEQHGEVKRCNVAITGRPTGLLKG